MRTYEQFKWLQALYEGGVLTEAELEDAKANVLTGTTTETSLIELAMRRFQPQSEVLRLDQEWEEERRFYMQRTRSGSYRLPNTTHIFVTGMVTNFLFMGLIVIGAGTFYETPLVAVGLLGIFAEWGITATKISKARAIADAYDEAYKAYRQNREALNAAGLSR